MTIDTTFEDPQPRRAGDGATLLVDVTGFEGPLDVLLMLARQQKVDLTRISILELAEQYLAFIAQARRLKLELAADYLVMAAWLAYLKSRLLLPEDESAEEPSGEELAARLAFRLRRLEAMREGAARLMARPRLGQDVFARGAPEGVRVIRNAVYEVSLYDLLKAYAEQRRQALKPRALRMVPAPVYHVEQALARLRRMLGAVPDWQTLESFLPADLARGISPRSALAATFVAGLELVREGKAEMQQGSDFGPIFLRRALRSE